MVWSMQSYTKSHGRVHWRQDRDVTLGCQYFRAKGVIMFVVKPPFETGYEHVCGEIHMNIII